MVKRCKYCGAGTWIEDSRLQIRVHAADCPTLKVMFEQEQKRRKPRRIQRKRTKGWRMPPNTVYVGRPTVYGNPFDPDVPLAQYESLIRETLETNPTFLDPLKGKDLACWCRLENPCHVDPLLRILKEKAAPYLGSGETKCQYKQK